MSGKIERTIKLITQQQILADVPPAGEGFPMRRWSIKIVAVGPDGAELPASFIDKVTYKLHPSFTKPTRSFKKAPFKLEEQGWGEFDMNILINFVENGGTKEITHDLHFQAPKYDVTHAVEFTKPSPALVKLLAESGDTPGYTVPAPAPPPPPAPAPTPSAPEETKKRKSEAADDTRLTKKTVSDKDKEWSGRPAQMERLAQGLQKLQEEDLLHVVRIVMDAKTPGMYVRNNLEEGEFSLDLYTLPEALLRQLWEFTRDRVEA